MVLPFDKSLLLRHKKIHAPRFPVLLSRDSIRTKVFEG